MLAAGSLAASCVDAHGGFRKHTIFFWPERAADNLQHTQHAYVLAAALAHDVQLHCATAWPAYLESLLVPPGRLHLETPEANAVATCL